MPMTVPALSFRAFADYGWLMPTYDGSCPAITAAFGRAFTSRTAKRLWFCAATHRYWFERDSATTSHPHKIDSGIDLETQRRRKPSAAPPVHAGFSTSFLTIPIPEANTATAVRPFERTRLILRLAETARSFRYIHRYFLISRD